MEDRLHVFSLTIDYAWIVQPNPAGCTERWHHASGASQAALAWSSPEGERGSTALSPRGPGAARGLWKRGVKALDPTARLRDRRTARSL